MKELDQIIYEALRASEALMTATDGRIISTCIEVPPTDKDNTPLPYIIVTDDGFKSAPEDKDTEWENDEDDVQASVLINAKSRKAVMELSKVVRQAVSEYMLGMDCDERPQLNDVSSKGTDWDWTKPCYYKTISYQCVINNNINDDE